MKNRPMANNEIPTGKQGWITFALKIIMYIVNTLLAPAASAATVFRRKKKDPSNQK